MFLQLNNITKTYPGVVALNNVTLQVEQGEVHALVGENGAGKSTLIKTCSGAVIPDSGSIVIDGNVFSSMNPKLSEQQGIAVGYQQLVEIAKAISHNAKVLIMDEPSAPLTKSEADRMYLVVDKLKAQGVTIIYISHRLEEIFRLSDRVTVMRDGNVVTSLKTCDTDIDQLVKLMVGRELTETYPERTPCIQEEVLLNVVNLSGNGLTDISFDVKRGEVLGVAGLIGSGRTELAELIFGVKPKTGGQIFFQDKEINPKSPRAAIDAGIALVPEDRKKQGALLDVNIKGNISMGILKRISNMSYVDKKEENKIASEYKESMRIKTPNLEQKIKNLSGGNQQKVIIAKWLAANTELIIFDEPTRGIDVGAKFEIYTLVNTLVQEGKAILMISSEMGEIIGMSDRIIVLSEGKVTGSLNKEEFNQETIMSMASITKGKV